MLSVEQVLRRLPETPGRIAELAVGLENSQLCTSPAPGVWSVRDVLAHLRSCSDCWGSYITAILSEDKPTLTGINPRTWIKTTNFLQEEFWKSLRAFEEQRAELMATLLGLTPEDWSRNAYVVDMLGGVFERSVQWYAEGIARHERPHLRQIHKIVTAIRP